MSAATCSLDAAGLEAQLGRYGELARYAAGVEHRPGGVVVRFDGDPPAGLLEHTLEVERACCPFFSIAYDAEGRRLAISIADEEHAEALNALVRALAPDTGERAASQAAGVASATCCAATTLASCCASEAKAECCGDTAAGPPARCGCGA